jgi:hypothetical protein
MISEVEMKGTGMTEDKSKETYYYQYGREKSIQFDESPFRKIPVSCYITIINSHHLN